MHIPKILLIYTGGTIGMELDENSGSLVPLPFDKLLSYVPELEKVNCELEYRTFNTPVDSSDADPEFWDDIAAIINNSLVLFDGFVILHGTDTMSYTASALSFLFQDLTKPIVLTGSQLPMGAFRTDGRENLISAIEVASAQENGESKLKEVAIYFEYSLYRGNRCHKLSTEHFDAIISPNYASLAEAGVNINWNDAALLNPSLERNLFQAEGTWSYAVSVIKIFPGMTDKQLEYAFEQENIEVFMLETFGAGNISMKNKMLNQIESAIEKGKIIVNVSQCRKGSVDQKTYASGVRLEKMGVISAGDMTFESAIVKAMFLLDKVANSREFKKLYASNLSGELTF